MRAHATAFVGIQYMPYFHAPLPRNEGGWPPIFPTVKEEVEQPPPLHPPLARDNPAAAGLLRAERKRRAGEPLEPRKSA